MGAIGVKKGVPGFELYRGLKFEKLNLTEIELRYEKITMKMTSNVLMGGSVSSRCIVVWVVLTRVY